MTCVYALTLVHKVKLFTSDKLLGRDMEQEGGGERSEVVFPLAAHTQMEDPSPPYCV